MNKTLLLGTLIGGIVAPALAQSETLDVVTYTPPKGWTKETKKSMVGYTLVDNDKKTWCRIGVYQSTTSKGSLAADFDSEWNELVVKVYKPKAAPEKSDPEKRQGWDALAGAGSFEFSGQTAVVLLFTATAKGRCVSVTALTNSNDHLPAIQKFLDTLRLADPGAGLVEPKNSEATKPRVTPPPTASAPIGKFAFDTTNFDDGWTARQLSDYVHVTKADSDIFLHYSIPMTDTVRDLGEDEMRKYFWNLLVAPRYNNATITNLPTVDNLEFYRVRYMEGEGTDKATGKRFSIGLRVFVDKGIVTCVEGRSSSKETYSKLFPNAASLDNLTRYNRFAVGKTDLVGQWSQSGASYAQYYNVYTGANAGMATVSSTYKIQFTGSGTFSSDFQGVNGFVGNLKVATEKKKGSFTMSNWELSMVDQEKKKTDYSIWFESVRGGRILHLQDKKYSGLHDALMKVK